MNLKYSRQRNSIKEFLKSRKDHPTADLVYINIKKEYPKVSLGTIYRNLTLLTEMGEISRIKGIDGADRYDANSHQHYHFICTECGEILDIEIDAFDHIDELAGKDFAGKITGHNLRFTGICPSCLKNKD